MIISGSEFLLQSGENVSIGHGEGRIHHRGAEDAKVGVSLAQFSHEAAPWAAL